MSKSKTIQRTAYYDLGGCEIAVTGFATYHGSGDVEIEITSTTVEGVLSTDDFDPTGIYVQYGAGKAVTPLVDVLEDYFRMGA
jgi:hypothetical protein